MLRSTLVFCLSALVLPACGAGTSQGSTAATQDAATQDEGAGAAVMSEPSAYEQLKDVSAASVNATAPDTFRARFTTTKGDFVIEVNRAWAPNGADRFYNLVDNGFYDEVRFFRVLKGFMAQFGISGDPRVNDIWRKLEIRDDPRVKSNTRGFVSYAMRGPNTRTSQLFINYKDNSGLDAQGFAPFGQVVEGMEVVDNLYGGYGEGPPSGRGPDQTKLQNQGNDYLATEFPKLDYVITARIEG